MKKLFVIILLLFASQLSFAQEDARLLRFPSIHENQVVFSYAGDLYTVQSTGGMARKLTSHIGYETFSRFSPDGQHIAFTGQYDGNTEIFTIPAQGGAPLRLTHTATLSRDVVSDRMGPNNIVMDWTPDGKNVVFRSRKASFNSFKGQLFSVSANGGLSEELPLPTGGFCSYSKDGKKLAFNRVFREFRTWKYYEGGMADDVWIYDFNSKKTINITDNKAQDIFPMWHEDEVYFCSDRDRTMNLFVYNTKTKETKKVTNFTKYDIKFPSIGGDKIIFENGGYLHIFDIKTQKSKKIAIQLADDYAFGRNELKDATTNISSYDVSPDGKRVVVSARGDIFSIPTKSGITRNLTQSSNAHDRSVAWSPDGKWIAYLSDESGEYEVYMQNQDGSEKAVKLTKGSNSYIFSVEWSPDSKKILFNDRKFKLKYVNIDTKKVTTVTKSSTNVIRDATWSSDNNWIAFTMPSQGMNQIYLYDIKLKKLTAVTDKWHHSYSPKFDKDGKYLFFISDRDFNPIYNDVEWNSAYKNMSRVYLITLAKDTPSPFAPENNEVAIEDKKDENDEKSDDKSKTIKIDLENIQKRIVQLPMEQSNYYNLSVVGSTVYANHFKSVSGKPGMVLYNLKTRKETKLDKNYSFVISANQSKMLLHSHGKFSVIDLPKNKVDMSKTINLSEVKVFVNRSEEWQQIYNEAWRQMRDFFYVENMHGVNWKNMHDKYAVMIPNVRSKHDLNYLIGELIGELNCGHAYISGGDYPHPKRIKLGLLGAKLERDKSGYFKITKILKSANWSKKLRSPLTEIGINAKVGEFIVAVNGEPTNRMKNVYEALIGKAGKQVELSLNTKASESGARKVIVVPIADEASLYYYDWVQTNIKKVDKATDGKVGYIHVPDMGPAGLNEFMKHFYPQLTKKALIIDDRGNGGGNVSPMLIERLNREIFRAKMRRGVPYGTSIPTQAIDGPKVMLIDNYSASDGDQFPHAFKTLKMGKVIGIRSWGGVVGIWGSLPFVDGTDLRKPESASYSAAESKFIIEGVGVEPDIEIDNDPAKEYAGEDEQLNKAIEVVLEELKTYKSKVLAIPPSPDKSK